MDRSKSFEIKIIYRFLSIFNRVSSYLNLAGTEGNKTKQIQHIITSYSNPSGFLLIIRRSWKHMKTLIISIEFCRFRLKTPPPPPPAMPSGGHQLDKVFGDPQMLSTHPMYGKFPLTLLFFEFPIFIDLCEILNSWNCWTFFWYFFWINILLLDFHGFSFYEDVAPFGCLAYTVT